MLQTFEFLLFRLPVIFVHRYSHKQTLALPASRNIRKIYNRSKDYRSELEKKFQQNYGVHIVKRE